MMMKFISIWSNKILHFESKREKDKRKKTKWKDEMSVECKVQGSSMMEMVVLQKSK